MRSENTKTDFSSQQIDFSGQRIVIGLDVHKKQWTVTLRNCRMELKTFSMNPSAEKLAEYLSKHYPGGEYRSVYEAGFCGFGIHRMLEQLGINNIVVNPGDVPTRNSERNYKIDPVDSRKLARELESRTIEGIYIPNEQQEELRSLSRLRQQLVKDQTRIKNRIKSLLLYYGKPIPRHSEMSHWSGKFIKYLEEVQFNTENGKQCMSTQIAELRSKRENISRVIKKLREAVTKSPNEAIIKNLCSVPGVAFITAITIYTELLDINRFSSLDKLSRYVGFSPSVSGTGVYERVLGLSNRHKKYLRNLLIESAWTAVRTDPALTEKYNKLTLRMSEQKAIIRISKKLLNRIRFVWKNNKPYTMEKKK